MQGGLASVAGPWFFGKAAPVLNRFSGGVFARSAHRRSVGS